MNIVKKDLFGRRGILGIFLIVLGVLLLAEEVGIITINMHHIIFSWKMLLILIGTLSLTHRGKNAFGIVLITIGVFFLLPDIFHFTLDMHKLFWSLFFLIIGVVILFHSKKDHERWHAKFRTEWHSHWHDRCRGGSDRWDSEETESEKKTEFPPTDFIDEVNAFSGGERKIVSKTFRGGKITSIFGGSNYDLLDCELAEGKNVLEMVNIFGGSKLLIPSDWKIHLDVVAIFGGFADKRRRISTPPDTSEKVLYITGVAIFGGGEIKSI